MFVLRQHQRYDIDDLIDWEPIDEQHRPRFRSNYPEDFLNRRPDWQNYDIDDEKIGLVAAVCFWSDSLYSLHFFQVQCARIGP